jgi:hypothetical protein
MELASDHGLAVPNRTRGAAVRPPQLLTGGAKKDRKAQRPRTMGIRRRTDDMRASTPTHGADPVARAKAISVVEQWKKQLAAGPPDD